MKNHEQLMITLLVIGARGGASKEWKKIGKHIHFIGFEPDHQECERLNRQKKSVVEKEIYYPYAISGSGGVRDFYITRRPSVASLYKPLVDEWKKYGIPGTPRNLRAEIKKKKKVSTIVLDNFCDTEEIAPDSVKIDTQGSELEILSEGFQKTITKIIGLEIEVEFIPLYQNQPLFSDVDMYLREQGFELFGLKRHLWKLNDGKTVPDTRGGRLVFGDALYFNTSILSDELSKSQIYKSLLLAYRYDLNDLVLYIKNKNYISDKQIRKLFKRAKIRREDKLLTGIKKRFYKKKNPGFGRVIYFDDSYGF